MKNKQLAPELELIDWDCKGNLIRLQFGKNGKQWGDDWNDAPYEHNAGEVYEEFVMATAYISIGWEFTVIEPNYAENNSNLCKEDLIKRKLPCLTLVDAKDDWQYNNLAQAMAASKAQLFFGDNINEVFEKLGKMASLIGLIHKTKPVMIVGGVA